MNTTFVVLLWFSVFLESGRDEGCKYGRGFRLLLFEGKYGAFRGMVYKTFDRDYSLEILFVLLQNFCLLAHIFVEVTVIIRILNTCDCVTVVLQYFRDTCLIHPYQYDTTLYIFVMFS